MATVGTSAGASACAGFEVCSDAIMSDQCEIAAAGWRLQTHSASTDSKTDSETDSGSTDSELRSHEKKHSEAVELWPRSEHASPTSVEAEDIEPCGPPDFFSSAPLVRGIEAPAASASLVGTGSPRPSMRCPVMT